MLVNGIPSGHIIDKIARRNKDYELEFINTDSNSDKYGLSVHLRRNAQKNNEHYKIRLAVISSILAYPALEMTWIFGDEEYETASRVYHRICDEVDDAKTDFDQSMMPVVTIAAKIREGVKPIAAARQEKHNILPIDESNLLKGVSDWRHSIYSNRYPNMSLAEKKKNMEFEGNASEQPFNKKTYKTREKY